MLPFCLLPRLCSSCSAKVLVDGGMWCTESARNFLTEEFCLTFPDTITVLVIILYLLHLLGNDFPGGSDSKISACNTGDPGSIPGSERYLGKGMATHSSILAWRIPWTEEPNGLLSMGSQTVRLDWAINTFTFFPLPHLLGNGSSKQKINVANEFGDIAGQLFADFVFAGLLFLTPGLPIHSLSFYCITLSLGQLLLLWSPCPAPWFLGWWKPKFMGVHLFL